MTEAKPGPRHATATDAPADTRRLLLLHREGDREAFEAIVADYRSPVYSYLARCGVAPADRDDLFQTVFLKIHRAAGQYQAERPPHPWIFTIVANEVRSYLRRRRVRELVFADATRHEPSDPAPGSERVMEARSTVAWLEAEVLRLSLAQREVVILACVEGLPLKEVAQALRLPLNTVKTHLRRARLALARRLARHGAPGPGKERSS
jgi:RNA polymerase sigma-70 factor (ECF subfamily)